MVLLMPCPVQSLHGIRCNHSFSGSCMRVQQPLRHSNEFQRNFVLRFIRLLEFLDLQRDFKHGLSLIVDVFLHLLFAHKLSRQFVRALEIRYAFNTVLVANWQRHLTCRERQPSLHNDRLYHILHKYEFKSCSMYMYIHAYTQVTT